MNRNSVKHFFALFCISLIALQHVTVLFRFRQPPQRRQVKHLQRHQIGAARQLQEIGARWGIASACVGGGQGIALLIENPAA